MVGRSCLLEWYFCCFNWLRLPKIHSMRKSSWNIQPGYNNLSNSDAHYNFGSPAQLITALFGPSVEIGYFGVATNCLCNLHCLLCCVKTVPDLLLSIRERLESRDFRFRRCSKMNLCKDSPRLRAEWASEWVSECMIPTPPPSQSYLRAPNGGGRTSCNINSALIYKPVFARMAPRRDYVWCNRKCGVTPSSFL